MFQLFFFEGIITHLYLFNDKKGSELYEVQKKTVETLPIEIKDITKLSKNINQYTLIIDGIFGIGYRYKEDKDTENLFKIINNNNAKKISIDIPSGLNPIKDISIKADYTYSIGFVKSSFFNIAARKNAGIIRDLKISFNIDNINRELDIEYLHEIPKIEIDKSDFVHKYSRGSCISIGGTQGKLGSIIYTANSALRAGSGISLVLSDKDNIIPINTISQSIIADSIENINDYIDKYNTIVIGPGLKLNEDQKAIIYDIIKLDKQFLLDASFFTVFESSILKLFKKPPILTPHSQEFISFFKDDAANLKSDTIKTVSQTAQKFNCCILLKESFFILALPDGKNIVIDKPQRLLAQAGSGDILSGIIAGLFSQGYGPIDSILQGIRIFHQISGYFKDKGFISYSPENFINLISKQLMRNIKNV